MRGQWFRKQKTNLTTTGEDYQEASTQINPTLTPFSAVAGPGCKPYPIEENLTKKHLTKKSI